MKRSAISGVLVGFVVGCIANSDAATLGANFAITAQVARGCAIKTAPVVSPERSHLELSCRRSEAANAMITIGSQRFGEFVPLAKVPAIANQVVEFDQAQNHNGGAVSVTINF